MRLAVYTRVPETPSLLRYREEIFARLSDLGANVMPFGVGDAVPERCDGVWDPGLGMRRIPRQLFQTRCPVVVTVPGIRAFSLSFFELGTTMRTRCAEWRLKRVIRRDWRRFSKKVRGVIAISNFGAGDIERSLRVEKRKITTIHLAPSEACVPAGDPIPHGSDDVGFLHVSVYRPAKNTEGVVDAYRTIPPELRPPLTLRCSGLPDSLELPAGVKVIEEFLPEEELVELYQRALALVFPSVYEHFGLPILEAMACGCPVITSSSSSCEEVAGNAAILVPPKDTAVLCEAMKRIALDHELRNALREKGLRRASRFTWERSAAEHMSLFSRLLS